MFDNITKVPIDFNFPYFSFPLIMNHHTVLHTFDIKRFRLTLDGTVWFRWFRLILVFDIGHFFLISDVPIRYRTISNGNVRFFGWFCLTSDGTRPEFGRICSISDSSDCYRPTLDDAVWLRLNLEGNISNFRRNSFLDVNATIFSTMRTQRAIFNYAYTESKGAGKNKRGDLLRLVGLVHLMIITV